MVGDAHACIPLHLISTLTLIGHNPCVCARKLATVSDPAWLHWHISCAKCIIRRFDLRHTCAAAGGAPGLGLGIGIGLDWIGWHIVCIYPRAI